MLRGTMRHAVHRVAARHEQPEQRVAALVVGGALGIDRVEQDVARGPERDLLHGLGEVPAWTSLWPLRAALGGPPRSRGSRRRRNSPTRTSPRWWTCSPHRHLPSRGRAASRGVPQRSTQSAAADRDRRAHTGRPERERHARADHGPYGRAGPQAVSRNDAGMVLAGEPVVLQTQTVKHPADQQRKEEVGGRPKTRASPEDRSRS